MTYNECLGSKDFDVTDFIKEEDVFISSEQKENRMAEEITVERVSPFGLMVGGQWLNGDKASNIDFKSMFHAGDVLNITKNGKGFITAAELVTKAPEKKAWTGGGKSYGGKSSEFRTTEQIIRSVAAEAAFESPVLAEQTKDMSKEEAIKYTFDVAEHIATFIEKGV